MVVTYDGDEPMYESSDNDDRGDGCADLGCLIIIIFIVYALFKCCN